jgi:UDP-3-O-[3-hydroxymyristoyl] glucosamine N-acyltransferase
MKNQGFTLASIEGALHSLNIPFERHVQRPLTDLRFCSAFAQEDRGIYFWDGEAPPSFAHQDIVVIAPQVWPGDLACVLVTARPQSAYYRLMRHFFAQTQAPQGIHPTAIVSPGARIAGSAFIGPYCVIGECEIGPGSHLDAHVVVHDHATIGSRVRIESHSTIGATGVAWVWDQGERIVQPQIGGTRIGDDCFLGTDVTVVRGSINEVTTLGSGCVIAHGSKIGHGSVIGSEVHFANNVSVAGNCRIGDRAFLSSACVLRPRISLAHGVTVGAGAVVTRDVDETGVVVSGVPARTMPSKDRHAGVPRAQL